MTMYKAKFTDFEVSHIGRVGKELLPLSTKINVLFTLPAAKFITLIFAEGENSYFWKHLLLLHKNH